MSSRRPPPKPERRASSKRPSTSESPHELPPLPAMPNPPQRFDSEPPTRQKNVAASVYQSLISVFDTMTPAQRMEFVDFAAHYATLDAHARRDLVELLVLYPALWAADRAQLHELAERLATKSTKRR